MCWVGGGGSKEVDLKPLHHRDGEPGVLPGVGLCCHHDIGSGQVSPSLGEGGPPSMWCHQPSPGRQELCAPRESARITQGPLSYPVPSWEAHLKVHQDVLELESPVQVQLQRDRVHVWKDKKEELQARDSPPSQPEEGSGPPQL